MTPLTLFLFFVLLFHVGGIPQLAGDPWWHIQIWKSCTIRLIGNSMCAKFLLRVSTSLWGLGGQLAFLLGHTKMSLSLVIFSVSLQFPQRKSLPILASGRRWLLTFWDLSREGREGCVLIRYICFELASLPTFIFVPDNHKSRVLMANFLLNPHLLFPLEVTERWALAAWGRGGT